MMPALIAIRAFFGGALKWLGGLNGWQLLCIALAIFGAVQTIRLATEQRHARKIETQLVKCTDAQRKLAEQSKAQQKDVARVIDHYVTVEKPVVQRVVERIESAPLPGNCKTPAPIMELDI